MTSNTEILEELRRINTRLIGLEATVAGTKGVVDAWNAAKSGGAFLKWSLGILASIGTAWLALKNVGVK